MSGKLVAHSGAEYIDREGLKALETPPATDTWTPIPHYELVTALEGQLRARGISIVKEQFAIQKAKLFGVIDTDYQVTEEGGAWWKNVWSQTWQTLSCAFLNVRSTSGSPTGTTSGCTPTRLTRCGIK